MRAFYNFIFKKISLLAILLSFVFLIIIFASIITKGYRAFYIHYLTINVKLTPDHFAKDVKSTKRHFTFNNEVLFSLKKLSKVLNLPYEETSILSNIYNATLTKYLNKHPEKIDQVVTIPLLFSSNADSYFKNYKSAHNNLTPENITFLNEVKNSGLVTKSFNWPFFLNTDSRYPEVAGISGALKGTLVTIFFTLIFSFIIGVSTAIYLEEFLKNKAARSIIEININNLAAVPSIIFGLLGLSLFQNLLCIPRSSPLLASMVLTLMILPNIIVYSQLAISSVPSSIKEGAYGIGATKNQVIFKHVFPLALPGIITGIIIGISRSIGETAPLLIIGMYIFVVNAKFTIIEASSTLPTQILMWFNMPEVGFTEKTSAAIIILLTITISINLIANYIRKKFTKKL